MSEPFVGEIRMFAGNFAPADWLLCQGQLVSISDYQTLYALIGNTYGGDGQTTFGLPNLASRVPLHTGTLAGNTYNLGMSGGAEQVTLITQQLPAHTHPLGTAGSPGTTNVPAANTILSDMGPSSATPPIYAAYDANTTVTLNPQSILPAGGSQQHANVQPCLAINFIISMFGIYPSQG